MPGKVAELTQLHDAWLEEMVEPVRAGAKRYVLAPSEEGKPKKPKSKRKKNMNPGTTAPSA